MTGPNSPVLACQIAIGRCYLSALSSMLAWSTFVLDPRPDLAIPARRLRLAYAWWW